MADLDEDWKKFLDATLDDDEEVETEEEDETLEDDDSEEEDQDEDQEVEDDEDDKDDPDKADPKKSKKSDKKKAGSYTPRLKQFKNDDGTLNAQELETAYIESSKNGVKLSGELEKHTEQLTKLQTDYSALLEAIKAKPEIAEALFGKEGAKTLANSKSPGKQDQEPTDPLLRHVKAQMAKASNAEYEEFIKDHPEAATDPDRAKKIGRFMKLYGDEQREANNGEIPSMKEALLAAYRYYGWDIKDKKKEDVATAAKKAAATRSTPRAHRKASKKEVTMSEQFFAGKLGVTLKKS